MWRLYDLAEKEITNFGGIYYADSDLERALDTYKGDRTVILGMSKCAISGLTLGFQAISMTVMNLYPEMICELYDHFLNNRLKEALLVQDKLMKRIHDIYKLDEDIIVSMKMEFNKLNLGFKCGATRKPVWTQYMIRH